MKIEFSRTAILALAGIQIIAFVCLYALLNRVNKLESSHNEEGHEKKEKYIFRKEEK